MGDVQQKAARPGGDDGPQTGIMVALMVPAELAQGLAVPDGLPPEELHITLAYLGKTTALRDPMKTLADLLDAVRTVAADQPPVAGRISGVGRFDVGEPGDVFYLSFDSPELEQLRYNLLEALDEVGLQPDQAHGYTPHISLTYLASGDRSPMERTAAVPCVFDTITVAWGGNRIDTPLAGGERPPQRVQPVEGLQPPEMFTPWAGMKVAAGGTVGLTPTLVADAIAEVKVRLEQLADSEPAATHLAALRVLEQTQTALEPAG